MAKLTKSFLAGITALLAIAAGLLIAAQQKQKCRRIRAPG
jgi:hypothetical protein